MKKETKQEREERLYLEEILAFEREHGVSSNTPPHLNLKNPSASPSNTVIGVERKKERDDDDDLILILILTSCVGF